MKAKIAVIGVGYVGLVTSACLAEIGHTISCVDIDIEKIKRLKAGEIPIYEPGLEELVLRNSKSGRLTFFSHLKEVIDEVDVIFLAVGTPPKADWSADLSAIGAVSSQIGKLLKKPVLIVTKSTVPVGTSDLVRQTIQDNLSTPIDFEVASNPEFLREGAAVNDFMEPDRIVVGVQSEHAKSLLEEIYHPIIQDGRPFIVTTIKSAEVIKYASNAFLATKISFINEIANFCEVSGATIDDVSLGMGMDSRIGVKYLHAGIGYGGSCFPKDVKALIATGETLGSPFRLLKVVEEINAAQQLRLIAKLKRHLKTLKNKRIALWGLAFKAKTDDVREAPALGIIAALLQEGAKVRVFDPIVKHLPLAVDLAPSLYDCCDKADALVIVTEWEDFLYPDFEIVKQRLKRPLIIDGRNIYDPTKMKNNGFIYESIGRE
jgi:UDPglucose 6-dehydrogenase